MAETAGTAAEPQTSDTETPTRWLARIHVTLKPIVLDPQGDAVLDGLHQLGFSGVSTVRVGKYLEVTLAAASHADADATVSHMCERLLANPVIERYTFEVAPSR